MLSQPLPLNVALPASTAAFIHRLLQRMADCPDLKRIRQVYVVMSGQSASILDLVPHDIVEQFASTCNSIMQDNTDHMRNLFCLAMYAFVAKETSTTPVKSSITSDDGAPPSYDISEWQKRTRKFFAGDRATKTTSLTVVRVLHFCSEEREIPTAEALEGLVLCTRIIEAVGNIIAGQWAKRKENELILKKLDGRLFSDKLASQVKIAVCVPFNIFEVVPTQPSVTGTDFYQGLNFYVSFACSVALSPSLEIALRTTIAELFVDCRRFKVLSELNEEVLSNLLGSTWVSMERGNGRLGLIDDVLRFAIDQCQPGRPLNPRSFLDTKFAGIAIASLRQNVTNSAALPAHIVNYLISQGVPEWWNLDLFGLNASWKASDDCSASNCCHHESEKIRLRLTASISSLFIEAALSPSTGPLKGRTSPAILSSLMQQLEKPRLAESCLSCSYNGVLQEQTDGLLAGNPAAVGGGSHEWRQNLAIALKTAASDSHELIIGHVNSICHDLETRCNTAEEPLQEALAKASALQGELDTTYAKLTATSLQKAELQNYLLQTREVLAAEIEEKIELQGCLDAAGERENMISLELAECEKAVSETKEEAVLKLKAARDSARMTTDAMQADHHAKVEELCQTLATEIEKVSQLKMDNDWIRSDGERLQEYMQRVQIHEAELEQRLNQEAETLAEVQQQVSQTCDSRCPHSCSCPLLPLIRAVAFPLSVSVTVSCADTTQEAESKRLLFEKTTLLVNTIAEAKALTSRLATKSQEVAVLLDQHRKCEAECQRLSHDLKEANSFRERIFAMVNHISPVDSPGMDPTVCMSNVLPPLGEKATMLGCEEGYENTEEELKGSCMVDVYSHESDHKELRPAGLEVQGGVYGTND
jgi:hypothetical protein